MELTALQRYNVVDSEQVIMDHVPIAPDPSHEIKHLLDTNCQILELPSHLASEDKFDFRSALLYFMATATPSPELANDILRNFDQHKDGMKVAHVSHFSPSGSVPQVEFAVDNVPDAVSPVKAKIAYIQVPNQAGDNTELHLVWKVCLAVCTLLFADAVCCVV